MWVELGFCRQLGLFKKRDYKYFEYKKVIFFGIIIPSLLTHRLSVAACFACLLACRLIWLGCLIAWHSCIFTCLRASRVCFLTCLHAWRTWLAFVLVVLTCLRAWCACVLGLFTCLKCFCSSVLDALVCLHACCDKIFYFLTCLHTWCAFLVYLLCISILKLENLTPNNLSFVKWNIFLIYILIPTYKTIWNKFKRSKKFNRYII